MVARYILFLYEMSCFARNESNRSARLNTQFEKQKRALISSIARSHFHSSSFKSGILREIERTILGELDYSTPFYFVVHNKLYFPFTTLLTQKINFHVIIHQFLQHSKKRNYYRQFLFSFIYIYIGSCNKNLQFTGCLKRKKKTVFKTQPFSYIVLHQHRD